MLKLYICFFVCLLQSAACCFLYAQPKKDTLFITQPGEYPIYKHLYIYETNKKITPEFVYDSVKSENFIRLFPDKAFNNLPSPLHYWLLVTITNKLPHDESFYCWLNSPDVSSIKIYKKEETNHFKLEGEGGYYIPYDKRQVKSHDAELQFSIKTNKTAVVLLYLENPDARYTFFLPKLADAGTRRNMQEAYYLVMGVVMGIMLIAFLLNIFYGVSLKENIHYVYALYVICVLYEIFNLEGIAENYFGTNDHRFAEMLDYVFPCLCPVLMARIMQWFLNQKGSNSYFKILLDFANGLLLFVAVLYIADYFVHFSTFFSGFLQILIGVTTSIQLLLIIISVIEKTIQKYKLAWLYLLATTCLIVGWFEYLALFLGINDVEIIESRHPNDFQIGSVVEVVVVFIAIIYRYNLYKKEKEKLLIEITEQQQNLIKSIVTAEEEERQRIAADLHDDVGATLSTLNLHISNVPESILHNTDVAPYLSRSMLLSSKAAEDIRDIAHNLLPKDFKAAKLFSLLQKRVDELNTLLKVRFYLITEGDEKRLNEMFSIIIYRIINELLTNILRHSLAAEATVQLLIEEQGVQIMTEDDGIGFDTKKVSDGIGLKNIKRRIEFFKGTILIDGNSNGTHTIIKLPL